MGPHQIQEVEGRLLFVSYIESAAWVTAINKLTGMTAADYIGITMTADMFVPEMGEHEQIEFMLMFDPGGAKATVDAIVELLSNGIPPHVQRPGEN